MLVAPKMRQGTLPLALPLQRLLLHAIGSHHCKFWSRPTKLPIPPMYTRLKSKVITHIKEMFFPKRKYSFGILGGNVGHGSVLQFSVTTSSPVQLSPCASLMPTLKPPPQVALQPVQFIFGDHEQPRPSSDK